MLVDNWMYEWMDECFFFFLPVRAEKSVTNRIYNNLCIHIQPYELYLLDRRMSV